MLREDLIRLNSGYCVVLIDLDRFKDYNDSQGHQGGDRVLELIGGILIENTRATERAYRYGGEELLVLLPDEDDEEGRVLAERLRPKCEISLSCTQVRAPWHRHVQRRRRRGSSG